MEGRAERSLSISVSVTRVLYLTFEISWAQVIVGLD